MADTNRSSATTNMNEHSSRSHMMLTVTIISENKHTGQISRGKLNLVDLAGSERINKSGDYAIIFSILILGELNISNVLSNTLNFILFYSIQCFCWHEN
jgi:hypothetical protein